MYSPNPSLLLDRLQVKKGVPQDCMVLCHKGEFMGDVSQPFLSMSI